MSVEFLCPHCRARMQTPDTGMGRRIGCPKCHELLVVPTVEIPHSAVGETAVFDRAKIAEQLDSRPEADVFDPTAAVRKTASRPTYRRKKSTPWLSIGFTVALLAGLAFAAYSLTQS